MAHVFVSLTPHGFGHAALTAPVVNALAERLPGVRVTLQTAIPRAMLERWYKVPFALVTQTPDFGFRMHSATAIDLEATAQGYAALHEQWPQVVAREAARLRAAGADLVLSSISYAALAAAGQAGVPAFGLSPLNWHEMYGHYFAARPEAARVLDEMGQAYGAASAMLKPAPSMPMGGLANTVDIGPVAALGRDRRAALAQAVGAEAGERIGLVTFGGVAPGLDLDRMPHLPGWRWVVPQRSTRGDFTGIDDIGLSFVDLLCSVDVAVTKLGYGMVSQAGVNGTPVLYVPRPDWPESPYLEAWLAAHGRCLPVTQEALFSPALEAQLRALFSLPRKPLATPSGIDAAVALCLGALAEAADDGRRRRSPPL